MTDDPDFLQRRALVTGAGIIGVGLAAAQAQAQTTAASAAWSPAREKLDDWLDIPARHRFVFDCITLRGAGEVMNYARNYYVFNQRDYSLAPSSLAVVILLRAGATPAGYNDAMWAKYGAIMGPAGDLTDPATRTAPLRNIFNTKGVSAPGSTGILQSELAERGTHFAVCGSATNGVSEMLAKATGGRAEVIRAELAANLTSGARLVPAGIITLNRAQERGYALANIG